MKLFSRACWGIFFSIFICFTAASAQISLTNQQIEQYIQTMRPLNNLFSATPAQDKAIDMAAIPVTDQQMLSDTPVTDGLAQMKTHRRFDAILDIITNAGFRDERDWASAGDKIMMAYSAYHLNNPSRSDAPSIDQIKQDLNERSKSIANNQFISREQKQLLLNKIENSMALLNDPNYIDSENIPMISPYIERLNSLFKELP